MASTTASAASWMETSSSSPTAGSEGPRLVSPALPGPAAAQPPQMFLLPPAPVALRTDVGPALLQWGWG